MMLSATQSELRCTAHAKLCKVVSKSTRSSLCRPAKLPSTFVLHTPRNRLCQAASSSPKPSSIYTVGDVMTNGTIVSCREDTTVDEALELLVQYRITGLPVVDDDFYVVGVVSDYDLLALDTLGRYNDDTNLFPEAEQSWQAFKEVKSLLAKTGSKRVKDVMTKKPIMVREKTDIDDAARILLDKKIRRLPVVDENGKLCGIISRSNLVKAALQYRKEAQSKST